MMMTGEQAVVGAGGPAVGATRGYVCPQRDQLLLLPPSFDGIGWRRTIWCGTFWGRSRRWIWVGS